MKFAQKLTLVILALLCVTLSLGGAVSIQQNFDHALEVAEEQNLLAHMRDCYGLETSFAGEAPDYSISRLYALAVRYMDEQHAAFGSACATFTIFSENGTPIYSSMPKTISYMEQWNTVLLGRGQMRYLMADKEAFLLLASPLRGHPLYLVTAHPMSALFEERDRQLHQYRALEGIVLVLAGFAAAGLAVILTRPLHRLEAASRKIAGGEYSIRVKATGSDEVGQLGRTFNSMADSVEEHMAALEEESERQKRFVGAFTHELKTPMTAILGYADLLRSGEQPADKRQKAANYIYHESHRLESLSRSLLSLLGLDHTPPQIQPVAVSAVFRDVLRSLPTLPLTVRVKCPENVFIAADRTLLADLLRNLVLNAVNAQPRENYVFLFCLQENGRLRLGVQDTGQGIPKEELDKILEPFYRVDKSRARKNGGNGVGLALCARIAEAHGSKLEILSKVGTGTCVSLVLEEVASC